MRRHTQISIPTLVRIKAGALDRLGIYGRRHHFERVLLLYSGDLLESLQERAVRSLRENGVEIVEGIAVADNSYEEAQRIFTSLSGEADLIVGLGGGKALDISKYVSFLSRIPYVAVPTSLSNDGFGSPQSSLTVAGQRRSLPAVMPYGVVIDTQVCEQAPKILWLSGVGDLVSKLTAVYDWKLAFHARGIEVDDFAALLSDATVYQLMAQPERTESGMQLLGTALMLNGVAMEVCGSSRPASGSEHLMSHALDSLCERCRLHGLQVGVATYLMSRLQGQSSERIARLFEQTGFWDAIRDDPFKRSEWMRAAERAPEIKGDFYTVLSERDCTGEIVEMIDADRQLQGCFV
jgi:glycerol-1-phosphate dehydrogenase [NAD(P)+]